MPCGPSWAPITGRSRGSRRSWGYGTESARLWARQADIDDGHAPGASTSQNARVLVLSRRTVSTRAGVRG